MAARRSLTAEDKEEAQALTIRGLRGQDTSAMADPYQEVKAINHKWVADIQRRFKGHIIRRNGRSHRWDGEAINSEIPPYDKIVATCVLEEAEHFTLQDAMVKMVGRCVCFLVPPGELRSSSLMGLSRAPGSAEIGNEVSLID